MKLTYSLGGAAAVTLVIAIICVGPMISLWVINWMAELGGSDFYIEHNLWSYCVTLVGLIIVKGGK